MSHLLSIVVILILSYTSNVQAVFKQTLCFPSEFDDMIDESTVKSLYSTYIGSIDSGLTELVTCTSTTLDDVNMKLHSCFLCQFEYYDTLTETIRYSLLSQMNNDLDAAIAVFETIYELALITYASADYAQVNERCTNMPYPRICRFDLNNAGNEGLSGITFGVDPFYFSLGLDSDTQTVFYEISLSTPSDGFDRWFGIGFGDVGMEGDAAIYTCGAVACQTPTITDYYLSRTPGRNPSPSDVISDVLRGGSDDFKEFVSTAIDGEFVIQFTRAFDTGDNFDKLFEGTETDINVFAAVGRAADTQLVQHQAQNVVKPVNIQFVPSPSDSDIEWCTEQVIGDCIVDVKRITTLEPTDSPTKVPTMNPSVSPTPLPTKNPTNTPTMAPTTDSPTTTEAPTRGPTPAPTMPQVNPDPGAAMNRNGIDVWITVICIIMTCIVFN